MVQDKIRRLRPRVLKVKFSIEGTFTVRIPDMLETDDEKEVILDYFAAHESEIMRDAKFYIDDWREV